MKDYGYAEINLNQYRIGNEEDYPMIFADVCRASAAYAKGYISWEQIEDLVAYGQLEELIDIDYLVNEENFEVLFTVKGRPFGHQSLQAYRAADKDARKDMTPCVTIGKGFMKDKLNRSLSKKFLKAYLILETAFLPEEAAGAGDDSYANSNIITTDMSSETFCKMFPPKLKDYISLELGDVKFICYYDFSEAAFNSLDPEEALMACDKIESFLSAIRRHPATYRGGWIEKTAGIRPAEANRDLLDWFVDPLVFPNEKELEAACTMIDNFKQKGLSKDTIISLLRRSPDMSGHLEAAEKLMHEAQEEAKKKAAADDKKEEEGKDKKKSKPKSKPKKEAKADDSEKPDTKMARDVESLLKTYTISELGYIISKWNMPDSDKSKLLQGLDATGTKVSDLLAKCNNDKIPIPAEFWVLFNSDQQAAYELLEEQEAEAADPDPEEDDDEVADNADESDGEPS